MHQNAGNCIYIFKKILGRNPQTPRQNVSPHSQNAADAHGAGNSSHFSLCSFNMSLWLIQLQVNQLSANVNFCACALLVSEGYLQASFIDVSK